MGWNKISFGLYTERIWCVFFFFDKYSDNFLFNFDTTRIQYFFLFNLLTACLPDESEKNGVSAVATHTPVCGFRYLDDTYVIWPHGNGKLTESLNHLSGLHNKISLQWKKKKKKKKKKKSFLWSAQIKTSGQPHALEDLHHRMSHRGPFNWQRGPQSWSKGFGDETNILPLSGIKQRSFEFQARSTVTVPTEISSAPEFQRHFLFCSLR